MVQIVAQADEREAFLQEFGDSRRAEQEQSEDDAVFGGGGAQLAGGIIQLGRVYMWGNSYFS